MSFYFILRFVNLHFVCLAFATRVLLHPQDQPILYSKHVPACGDLSSISTAGLFLPLLNSSILRASCSEDHFSHSPSERPPIPKLPTFHL
jgi:hypothetical protein